MTFREAFLDYKCNDAVTQNKLTEFQLKADKHPRMWTALQLVVEHRYEVKVGPLPTDTTGAIDWQSVIKWFVTNGPALMQPPGSSGPGPGPPGGRSGPVPPGERADPCQGRPTP